MTEIQFDLDQSELSFTASGGSAVRRTVLPSGVRVLTESVPGVQSTSISISVPVGSRDETNGHFGSTHFLEHLLFKGTKRRSALDIAIAFDSVGGSSNAATGKEHTSYYAKVQESAVELAVDVICDMLTSSVIDKAEFENERTVILEELAMNEDDPQDVAHEAFFEEVLGEHELGRPIGGTNETITAVSRDAVWEHYQANYQPRDLVVAAAGSIDHDRLIQLVEAGMAEAGWDLAAHAAPRPRRPLLEASVTRRSKLRVIHEENAQANILIGSKGIVGDDDRRYAMAVLNTILGGGMSSRLFQEIREKRGLAYSTYSFNQGYSDAGVFGLYAGCSPAKAREVTELMLVELEKIATSGVTQAEMDLAYGNVSGGLALKFENTAARMSRLSGTELSTGKFVDLDEALARYRKVTIDEVTRLASTLLASDRTLVAVGDLTEDTFAGLV
ncbi:MAG: M16 family metallopeptidase [Microbacteriaceae bacterium]